MSSASAAMAPSIDRVTSLFCAEDALGSAWGDEEETSCADEQVSTVAGEVEFPALLDFPVDDEDAIAVLVEKEARLLPDANYLERSQSTGLTAGARESAVFWMLKVPPGFAPAMQCKAYKPASADVPTYMHTS